MVNKKLKKPIKIFLFFIGLIFLYFFCGFIYNYLCYNKTIVHIWQSPPWETTRKAIERAKTTKNTQVKFKLLEYTAFCEIIPISIYILLFLYFLSVRKRTQPNLESERSTLKGSASWGNEKDYHGVYVFDWNSLPPVILGQSYDAELDITNPQDIITKKFGKKIIGCDPTKINIMTMGGIGSMKGVSTIVPTLLSYKESVIVYDPAKENFNITAGYRQELGRVQYFDPTDKNCTLHFNALDWIRRNKDYVTADVDNICSILIPTNEKDRFFSQNARNLLSIYISYILLFFPKDKQNLKEVTSLITIMNKKSMWHYKTVERKIISLRDSLSTSKKENEKIKILHELNYWNNYLELLDDKKKKEMDETLKKEKDGTMLSFINRLINDIQTAKEYGDIDDGDNEWKSVLLERAYATASKMRITAAAEQTIAGIEGEITSNMQFFAESGIANLTKDTSFTIEEINREKDPLSLYLCIANADTERCKTFVKLFISCLLKQLTADYTIKRTHHTLFILDEFPQLGRIDEIILAVPFVRKYGISFMLIFQSISQLESEKCYGKTDTKALRSNAKILDIKQVGDPDDAKWVSSQLGKRTIILENQSRNIKKGGDSNGRNLSVMTEGRDLLNETETTQLPADEGIIIIGQSKPLRIKKFQYFAHEYFQMLANKPYDVKKEIRNQKKINYDENNNDSNNNYILSQPSYIPALPQKVTQDSIINSNDNLKLKVPVDVKKRNKTKKIDIDDILI